MKMKFSFATNNDFNKLIVEPWGREFVMVKGDTLNVELDFIEIGIPNIVVSDEFIIFSAWQTCRAKVLDSDGFVIAGGEMDERSF